MCSVPCTWTQEKEQHAMAPFTPGELEVMRILWEHGELKPAEIQKRFPKPIKNPALRSYLSILVDKGHVARRREGKGFLYKAKTRKQSAFGRMVREIADAYCEGSPRALLMALIQSEKLSDSELLRLKRLAQSPPGPRRRQHDDNQ